MKRIAIYTDGACEGNPGPGGWAAILVSEHRRRELSGYEPQTTNNRMEMQAALEGLLVLKGRCEVDIYTDSQYLRNGMEQWLTKWKRNGWRTADRKPVKNADLWERLDTATQAHVVHWHWLRGHSGHAENERCDVLANEAIRRARAVAPAVRPDPQN